MFTIIGQESAVEVLQRSYNDHRRHHAWIFSGPRGVGKCTTAIQFAKLILQMNDGEGDTHPDLHIIRKEDVVWSQNPALQRKKQTNIPMDLLRERMIGGTTSDDRNHEAIAYKTPIRAKEKVFIIDEAELLDEPAQNVLLKTLEEPPAGTTIILVTSRDDRLLPTIMSRCQQVGFAPLGKIAMLHWAKSVNLRVAPADLEWAIHFSGGSPGLVQEAIGSELPALVHSISGFLDSSGDTDYTKASSLIIDFVESHVSKKLKENPQASKEAVNRSGVELVLIMFGLAARNMIRGDQGLCKTQGDRFDSGIMATAIISDVEGQLSTNISVKVLLESLAARWAHLCGGDSSLTKN